MTLANNHLNDFGDLPVNYTVDALKEVGIKTVGVTHGPYNSNQVKNKQKITGAAVRQWKVVWWASVGNFFAEETH